MRVGAMQADIALYSFGRDNAVQPVASYTIDVSGLRDPQSNRGFKHRFDDGRAGEVQSYVREDSRYPAILDLVKMLVHLHLISDARDAKWLSFAFKDIHGKWISPAITEAIADDLSSFKIHVYHYGLDNKVGAK